ncbi:SpoIIE family protein phosphatase [Actinomadura flavalba]|uniref:SpoIIE family protein phosphatase n=1 Tax=Actinomadura flavalba TaxID=1120938 RepID=UPI000367527A|nr:SpoIIE family protein phosphatase [Actinomadura flavalba]
MNVRQEQQTPARTDGALPRVLGQPLLGLAAMAVLTVDARGRVAHWSRTATDLFRVEGAGRAAADVLRPPPEHRDAFTPGDHRRVRCGVWRTAGVGETAWWIYPLPGPGVLALATDFGRLRDHGPDLGLGGVLLPTGGARLLHAEPVLAPAPDVAALAARFGGLLPADGAAALTARVAELGQPAVDLGVAVRLPMAPHRPGTPRALRVRNVPEARPAPPLTTGEQFSYLSEAGDRIAGALDHVQASRTLAEVAVPGLADAATVELLEGVAAAGEEDGVRPEHAALVRHIARAPGPVPEPVRRPAGDLAARVLSTGAELRLRGTTAEAEAELAGLGVPGAPGRDLLVLPLAARGQTLGVLRLLRGPGRTPFTADDLAAATELARRAGLGIDNGRRYRREAHTVHELQRTMLPADPPRIPGAEIRFRYRPAGSGLQVGGDWFDAFPLPGGRLGLVIGDVMGHGLTSAAIMGQLRMAVRALAAEDPPPARLLRRLDELTHWFTADYLGTCLYAVYDPVARRCRIGNAGHVPPVLITPGGGARVLDVPAGVPIGLGTSATMGTAEFDVPDGSRLVLCTDGLVERRDRDIDVGLEELRAHLADAGGSLDELCDGLLDTLADGTFADDVAVAALSCDGIPCDDVATFDLAVDPRSAGRARAATAARLTGWGLGALAEPVTLLVSELVANAVQHGRGPIVVRLVKAGALLGEVHDTGTAVLRPRTAAPTDEAGRGLTLVEHLAARWGTRRTEHGKAVWFELPLPRR